MATACQVEYRETLEKRYKLFNYPARRSKRDDQASRCWIRSYPRAAYNRRANVSTRRMTRFTLGAWLGGEIATTRRLTWEILSSYRITMTHAYARNAKDNSSRLRFIFRVFLDRSHFFLYDSSSDVTKNGFTLLVRGHECLEFLDRVLKLVQVRGCYYYIYMCKSWGKLDNERDDCRFTGTSEHFSSNSCAELCARRELDQFGATFELRQGEHEFLIFMILRRIMFFF